MWKMYKIEYVIQLSCIRTSNEVKIHRRKRAEIKFYKEISKIKAAGYPIFHNSTYLWLQ